MNLLRIKVWIRSKPAYIYNEFLFYCKSKRSYFPQLSTEHCLYSTNPTTIYSLHHYPQISRLRYPEIRHVHINYSRLRVRTVDQLFTVYDRTLQYLSSAVKTNTLCNPSVLITAVRCMVGVRIQWTFQLLMISFSCTVTGFAETISDECDISGCGHLPTLQLLCVRYYDISIMIVA